MAVEKSTHLFKYLVRSSRCELLCASRNECSSRLSAKVFCGDAPESNVNSCSFKCLNLHSMQIKDIVDYIRSRDIFTVAVVVHRSCPIDLGSGATATRTRRAPRKERVGRPRLASWATAARRWRRRRPRFRPRRGCSTGSSRGGRPSQRRATPAHFGTRRLQCSRALI